MSRLRWKKIVLFTNYRADYYGSSSGGGRKKSGVYSWGDNKFIDFFSMVGGNKDHVKTNNIIMG